MPYMMPPAIYDHPPAKPPIVIMRSLDELEALCADNPWGDNIGACTMVMKNGQCLILWLDGDPVGGVLWRHERAHCNGWPPEHPGGVRK